MREIKELQKKALSWITANCQFEHYQNQKLMVILPLSICFELHDYLLFHTLFLNQFDIQNNDYVDEGKGTRTRQKCRGEKQELSDDRMQTGENMLKCLAQSVLSIQSIQ